MWDSVLSTVVAAVITGPIGYLLKARLAGRQYLPGSAAAIEVQSYDFIKGDWHLYHLTGDSKKSSYPILVTSVLKLAIDKSLIVTGSERVQADHRRPLSYDLRGEVRAGQLHITCICREDTSDIYSAMFPNLLDDEAFGIMVARDYDRFLYSSPALISKRPHAVQEARLRLNHASLRFYQPENVMGLS